jgi:hypothetical protein
MDGISRKAKITFSFGNLAKDAAALAKPWEAYLRLVGEFEMEVSGEALYSEVQFCLVEFAIESQLWSRIATLNPADFTYTSIESEQPGLIWFRSERDGWKVGSAFQRYPCSEVLGFGEIVAALDDYYERLRREVRERFNLDIARLFEWRATQRR